MSVLRVRAVVCIGAIVVAFAAASFAGRADAAPTISEPHGNPSVVRLDKQGRPIPFTIAVSGFPSGSLVYVEQCDARAPSAPDWAPTRDCDIGSSPAAAIVDSSGRARFDAADRNHSFQPFAGLGPESLFNCLPRKAAPSKNGLPDYPSCQIRVASNNTQTTADQVFLPIVFDAAGSTTSSGSSRSTAVLVIAAVVLALGLGWAAAAAFRRRARRSA
jgi:hypothetical protein